MIDFLYPNNSKIYRKFYIKAPLSNNPPPSNKSLPFQGKKVNKPQPSIKHPLPTPNYSSLINDRLY